MSDAKQTSWDFACVWYTVEYVHAAITRRHWDTPLNPIPADIESVEFAEWLVENLRLAMAKGIEIGRKWDVYQG